MARFRYITADVFTNRAFGGNQLAVFPDATGIPEHRLLDVTREFNYSETTFVYPAEDPGNTRKVRIFTPGAEVPFAGHPTVGTAHALAAIGDVKLTGESTNIVFEEGVGPIPITITAENGVPQFAQFAVARLPELGPPAPDATALAALLGLSPDDFVGGDWNARAYSCGLSFLYVPLRNIDAVSRAQVRTDLWEQSMSTGATRDICVFAREGSTTDVSIHSRVFVPGFGVPEDPATGSAAAALAGYLAAQQRNDDGTLQWRIEQGIEMGRPSIIDVEADVRSGRVNAVRVGGASVLVCEGTMEIS